jgi:hypothetical protein
MASMHRHSSRRGRNLAAIGFAAIGLLIPEAGSAKDQRQHPSLSAWDAGAVNRALALASDRLREPECQRLFDDFEDGRGRPLREKLDELGLDGPAYLQTIAFRNGDSARPCRTEHVLMVAYPGRRDVYVCATTGRAASRLALTLERNPHLAEFSLIHEMLHTLGLGENPPTSREITHQVKRRCGRVSRQAAQLR